MKVNTNEILKFIEQTIHSVIIATVDDNGLPVTCAIDIMDSDEKGLYFLTAKGKGFYDRLKKNGYAALTGMKGNDTLSCVAVSIRGKVQEIGNAPLQRLFTKIRIWKKFIRLKNLNRLSLFFNFTRETANGLTFQRNRLNEFHLPLETEKKKCKDMKSRANVRTVKCVNRSARKTVLILP